jgi:hypothetical protein
VGRRLAAQPVEPPLTLAIANLSDALAVAALPAVEEIPRCSVVDIRRSLVLVLRALQFNCNLRDLRAAESCFRSWTQTSWVDPVSRVAKKKPRHGWTLEQYAQPGFAVSYARKLHVPRVAATRQLMLWLLEHAPGLPDGHLSVGDLGAGTCAACLGAHLAVRDLVGEGHPLTLHPIDAASSSSRFHRSFAALTRKVPFSKPPPMPLASTSSEYLVSTAGSVDDLARSLFRQVWVYLSRPVNQALHRVSLLLLHSLHVERASLCVHIHMSDAYGPVPHRMLGAA